MKNKLPKLVLVINNKYFDNKNLKAIAEELGCQVVALEINIEFVEDSLIDMQQVVEMYNAYAFVLEKQLTHNENRKKIASFYGRPDSKVKMLIPVYRKEIDANNEGVLVFNYYQTVQSI